MKTFLGFALGVCVGAFGFAVLLISTPDTDILIKDATDFCRMK